MGMREPHIGISEGLSQNRGSPFNGRCFFLLAEGICFFLLVLQGVDFTTGHIFSFVPGDENADGGYPLY